MGVKKLTAAEWLRTPSGKVHESGRGRGDEREEDDVEKEEGGRAAEEEGEVGGGYLFIYLFIEGL